MPPGPHSPRRPQALRALAGPAFFLLLMAVLVRWFEPRFVFYPLRGEQRTPDGVVDRWEPIEIPTEDGERLRAWWLEHPEPRADVIYFHGNGGNLSLWLPVYTGIHAQGLNVLAVDYRGYGASTGSPTEQGLYADARAVLAHYASRGNGGRRTVYWGRSLGGVVAAYAAARRAPDALILESTFPDKASVLRRHLLLRALNVFATYELPTARFIRDVRAPTLVLHGDADTVIPFQLGRELYEGIAGPKRFVRLPGIDHNVVLRPDDEAYWGPIREWIEGE